jgi:hypothetical protein
MTSNQALQGQSFTQKSHTLHHIDEREPASERLRKGRLAQEICNALRADGEATGQADQGCPVVKAQTEAQGDDYLAYRESFDVRN